jgi:hypothetical protein
MSMKAEIINPLGGGMRICDVPLLYTVRICIKTIFIGIFYSTIGSPVSVP